MIITIMDLINTVLPLTGATCFIVSLNIKDKHFATVALWISLIALVFHYQTAGGEILGSYFDYSHATMYTFTILLLCTCVAYTLRPFFRQAERLFVYFFCGIFMLTTLVSSALLLANLWINACFIENKMPKTDVLQVASFTRLEYCHFPYVFYKVSKEGFISYLCPNHYGLIPSVGRLDKVPKQLKQTMGLTVKSL